ncbi:DUF6571 family protein [Streptomyces sp. PU-14G]|uniref:DUF6571 family protein n=1 Tax=Streptomyces sp. PU-14G TaxID=2800808 RepID=UPI0034DF0405
MTTPPELEYTSIRDANLEPLREAAKKWQKLPGKIDGVAVSFSRTVSSPLERSGWYGETASAAFKKFGGVRRQMSEAAGLAAKISTNMSEALATFEFSQEEIRTIEKAVTAEPKDGSKNYLKLDEAKGTVSILPGHKDDIADFDKLQQHVDECNRRIRTAISDASKADHALKTVLQIDPPGKGFNDDIAGHLVDVRKETKEDVDALMKLAGNDDLKKDPKLLSQFNGILAKNAHNADFAEQFATRKGAKGVMEFWNKVARPEYEDGPFSEPKKRPEGVTKQLAALQDNLGDTLALASHSDSPKMQQWKHDVIALGDNRLPGPSKPGTYDAAPPYGFQVMSNLMRTGKWDADFLNDYGDKLLKEDKRPFEARGGRTEDDGHRKWLSEGLKPVDYLNFGPKADQGADPMTGFLEAMGHNGDASTEFFSNDDHFDYLLRERKYIQDGANSPDFDPEKDVVPSREALGHALGAAATGHAWDAPLDHSPSHTKEQADLMSKLVKAVGQVDEDRMKIAPGMHDGLGAATAEYSADFFRAIKDGSDDTKLFPMSGAQAGMSHGEATRFLVQVGQDADANAQISLGQKHYTAQVLEHHLAGDLPPDQRYDASRKETVEEILRTSGETTGTLAIGRQEALIAPAIREEQDFDKATLSKRLWANGGVGVVTGTISALEPIAKSHPLTAAVTSAVITGATGAGLSDADSEYWSMNKSTSAAHKASLIYDELSRRDVQQNEEILNTIRKEHNVKVSSSWAETFSDDGFSQAYSRVGTTAPFLSSLDKVKELAD